MQHVHANLRTPQTSSELSNSGKGKLGNVVVKIRDPNVDMSDGHIWKLYKLDAFQSDSFEQWFLVRI